MEDKQNKFLDKVLESLIKDTKIDYENKRIKFPFIYGYISIPLVTYPALLLFSPSSPHFSIFSTYCKGTYGLTDQEIRYLWKKYKGIIIDKINNKGNINESEDKQNKFLDKVIEFLVDDTIIDYENNLIHFPFLHVPSFSSIVITFPQLPLFLSLSSFFHSFLKYCENTYGLSEQEVEQVWKKYRSIIIDKIR